MSGGVGSFDEKDVVAGSADKGLDIEAESGSSDGRPREVERLFHFGPVVIATKRTIPLDRIIDHTEHSPTESTPCQGIIALSGHMSGGLKRGRLPRRDPEVRNRPPYDLLERRGRDRATGDRAV